MEEKVGSTAAHSLDGSRDDPFPPCFRGAKDVGAQANTSVRELVSGPAPANISLVSRPASPIAAVPDQKRPESVSTCGWTQSEPAAVAVAPRACPDRRPNPQHGLLWRDKPIPFLRGIPPVRLRTQFTQKPPGLSLFIEYWLIIHYFRLIEIVRSNYRYYNLKIQFTRQMLSCK